MEIFESSIFLLRNTANILTDLLTVIIAILIIGFIVYLKYDFCRKYEKWEKEKLKSNNKSKYEYAWQCLLIDGVWGSGKTTHYETYYQYIDDKPNIYISCFSASRSELIAQIIQQQFWCKLLTLNGLLAKLMESNWQVFMPKNRVIVFDDLERLHANQDNYLDLIGIIDYLKDKNKCQLILICNMSELKEPIFNTYMERIVDEVLDWEPCTIDKILPDNVMVLTKLVVNYLKYYSGSKLFHNNRIVKNILQELDSWIKKDTQLSANNIFDLSIIAGFVRYDIYCIIKWRYIFFYDYNFFINLVHEVHDKFMGYERGKKVIKPSYVANTDSNSSNDHIYDFDKHYLSDENNKGCQNYKIDSFELKFLAKAYSVFTHKTDTQLHTEYYRNLSGEYVYRDKKSVTFNINKILKSKFENYNVNQFKINVIFEIHIGLGVVLSILYNTNFYRSSTFWFLDDDYENIINIPLEPEPEQFARSISKHPDVFKSIQEYKEYLRTKSKDFNNQDYIKKIITSSDLENMIIKLGILYFVDKQIYENTICKLKIKKSELEELCSPTRLPLLFFSNIDIMLWCFDDINEVSIQSRMNNAYQQILDKMKNSTP